MKKFFIVFFLFSITVLLSACWKIPPQITWPSFNYKTWTVFSWDLIEYKNYIWYTAPSIKTQISTEIWWYITQIMVKKWDTIQKDQIIANIDVDEMLTVNNTIEDNIESLTNLLNTTSESFDLEIKSAQNKLEQARLALEISKTNENSIWWDWTADKYLEQIELEIKTYEVELEKSKSLLDTKETQIYKNSINTLSQSLILLKNIWIFLDELMWISDEKKDHDDSYEMYFWAKDIKLKNEIKDEWQELNKEFKIIVSDINNLLKGNVWFTEDSVKNDVYDTLIKSETFLKKVLTFLEKSHNMVDSSILSIWLTQNMIDNYKKTISDMQMDVEWLLLTTEWDFILWVQWNIQSINNFKEEKDKTITLLEKQIDIAKKKYDTTKDRSLKEYEIAKKQYDEILSNIDVIKSQKNVKLSEIQTKIAEAKWKQNITKTNIKNSIIKSPFDWIVLEKFIEVWQFVNIGSPIIDIWTDNIQEIKLLVPVKDAQNYSIWKELIVNIPDVGNTYEWIISDISPITDDFTKKLEIIIQFYLNDSDIIPYWTYATIDIPFQSYTWLLLDLSFIQYDFGEAFVFVQNLNDTSLIEKKYIEIINCSNQFCVINNWLVDGDIIIKKTK